MGTNWLGLFIAFLITFALYMLVPVVLRIKNGYYEEDKAKKIALWNSIIVCIIDYILASLILVDNNLELEVGPAFIYYFVNLSLLKYDNKEKNIDNNVQNKEVDTNTCNIISKNNDEKDLKSSEKNIRDESESEEEDDDESDSMSLVGKLVLGSFLLIVAYNIAGVYFSAKFDNDTNKLNERIEELEDENAKLIEENTELNSDLLKITGLNTNDYIIDKLEFFDNNIVFVLEGYGNYYYSYDCVQKITDGRQYSYWAYNKEAATSRGYYQGTC